MYHEGELNVQKKAHKESEAQMLVGVMIDYILPRFKEFLENQYMLLMSSKDDQGKIWSSPIMGTEGMITIPDERTFIIDRNKVITSTSDILYKNIVKTSYVGLMIIDPTTRKRFRINGKATLQDNSIKVEVIESYGNCPKYLQKRVPSLIDEAQQGEVISHNGKKLEKEHLDWISKADTLFIGSSNNGIKMDSSHRGGNIGFIELIGNDTLRVPDYIGNNMFNTLGNIDQNPNIGLTFINFETGKILQLTGKASIEYDQNNDEDLKKSMGTGVFWQFKTEEWVSTSNHHPVTWEFQDFSPFNPN